MVFTTRCWADELLQNQPTAKINQFSQQTTATICSTGEHSWYQLSKDHYNSTSDQKLIPYSYASIAARVNKDRVLG